MSQIRVDVPATCSGIGAERGTLALAIGLYNTIEIAEADQGLHIDIEGFGESALSRSTRNLVVKAATEVFRKIGVVPSGLAIKLINRFPERCGLGGSSAAVLGGLIGANDLLGGPLSREELIRVAYTIDADFAALLAALYGNLVVTASNSEQVIFRAIPIKPLELCVVSSISTEPASVTVTQSSNAVQQPYEEGRVALIVQALMAGDHDLLRDTLLDPVAMFAGKTQIRGHREVTNAAIEAGASGVFVAGHGPALAAFAPQKHEAVVAAMVDTWKQYSNAEIVSWILPVETHGVSISETGVVFDSQRALPISAGGNPVRYIT